MRHNNVLEKIVIIDFGAQFTQLIARKVREVGVYSEIVNFNQVRNLKNNKSIKGIILSGGPLTTTNKNSISLDNYILSLNLPILGICYGHQILAKKFGGKVKISKTREFWKAFLKSKLKLEGLEINSKPSIQEAIRSIPIKDNEIILITGSLYLAGEVLNLN